MKSSHVYTGNPQSVPSGTLPRYITIAFTAFRVAANWNRYTAVVTLVEVAVVTLVLATAKIYFKLSMSR